MSFGLINTVAHLYPPFEIRSLENECKERKQKNFGHYDLENMLLHSVVLTIPSTVNKTFMYAVAVFQVKYSSDQRQMKGRRSVILDTPELRHVKETQNNISMVGYLLLITRIY